MLRVLLFVALGILLAPAPARASPVVVGHRSGSSCKGKRDFGFGAVEAFATTFKPSGLAVNGDDTPRRLVGLPAPFGSALLVGGGVTAQFRCDYVGWDILSLRLSSAIGPGGAGAASANGQPVDVSLGPLHLLEIGVPFFGVPNVVQIFPADDWKVSLKLDWGVTHAWSSATLSGGLGAANGSVDNWDLFFRAQLAACLRLGTIGPSKGWGCVTASPTIYENGWFSGASVGVRVDL